MRSKPMTLEPHECTYEGDYPGKVWPSGAHVQASGWELDKMLAGGYYVVQVDKMGVLKVISRVTRIGLSYEEFCGEDEP